MSTYKPIVMRYRWDKANFKKAFEELYAYRYKHSIRRYIGWLFIAMTQFGVVALFKGGSPALLLFSTVLVLYWYWGKPTLLFVRAKRDFDMSNQKDTTVELRADEVGISDGEAVVPWEYIEGVVSVGEEIMLYTKGKSHYIPQNAFASLEERSRFKSLAKAKGVLRA